MLMLEPASILTLESFRRLPPIVHKGNPGLYLLYPEQIRRGFARLLPSKRETAEPVFEQQQARFLNVDGNVRVKKANEVKWASASLDMPLEKGDVVQTSGGGRARVSFADGTVYTMLPDTLIVVEENASMPDSNVTNVSVQVNSGKWTC